MSLEPAVACITPNVESLSERYAAILGIIMTSGYDVTFPLVPKTSKEAS